MTSSPDLALATISNICAERNNFVTQQTLLCIHDSSSKADKYLQLSEAMRELSTAVAFQTHSTALSGSDRCVGQTYLTASSLLNRILHSFD